jgi:hypothetical protein
MNHMGFEFQPIQQYIGLIFKLHRIFIASKMLITLAN